jgi:hypothetical protein
MYSMTARVIVAAGGLLSAAASYVFVYNMWRTIDGPRSRRSVARAGAEVAAVTALRRRAAS